MTRLHQFALALTMLLLLAAATPGVLWLYAGRGLSDVPDSVHDEVATAVRGAFFRQAFVNDYIEEDLLPQAKRVKAKPLADRLLFDREILKRFALDNYVAVYFLEDVVGTDDAALYAHLRAYQLSDAYDALPLQQRQRVDNWTDLLSEQTTPRALEIRHAPTPPASAPK
ncbi:hypothetical protein SAMN02745857_02785 [Andreprevotia lacus DSM 23236]|jgi:hypothetical protein|uniref:Uncharacterized protein n=1 Tax=Andreprevotia lacus DSM 23236 TaxID=1121001 RepID=A0A1W1XTJ2_9NEIS|nr:hypothetical protein [Andreprevotia lacus]SMC27283.1 hypothetical protein SAMN02745857_02785 [Andreprevotia lacus DSM 23236]